MLTAKEAAARLDRCEYGSEGSPELFAEMKEAGLVAMFGASDDLIEMRGAENDETDAYGGTKIHFTSGGFMRNDCASDACPYFEKAKSNAALIEVINPEDDDRGLWDYITDIPHAKFTVMEDDEVYGMGIVFALENVA